MSIPPKYPMTDFHEINLDYLLNKYFEIDAELKAQIGGLVLDNNASKLRLLDKDGNVISSVVVAFATNAATAGTAASAYSATSAQRATKDDRGNNITSYVKSVSVSDNVITFYDATGANIANVGVVTGSIIDVDLHNTEDQNDHYSMNIYLDALNVGESAIFASNYSHDQIEALFEAGNDIHIKHHLESDDPEVDGVYTFNAPLYYNGAIEFTNMVHGSRKVFVLDRETTPGTIPIRRLA